MLRIRGKLYLGRGITDTPSDEEDQHEEDYDEDHLDDEAMNHESYQQQQQPMLMIIPQAQVKREEEEESSSLLEKILTSPRTSPGPGQQQIVRSSGGSVEILDPRFKLIEGSHLMPLTPPPSISGDSNARSTPPEMVAGYTALDFSVSHHHGSNEPLDLSKMSQKSSPVILEPVSPPWRSGAIKKVVDEYESFVGHGVDDINMESEELGRAERIAVNALMALAKGH